MQLNVRANPIEQYLFEEVLPAKHRGEIIMNLLFIANMPFSMDAVENLFEFPETIVGDNWELWYTDDNAAMYGLLPTTPETGETIDVDFLLPIPKTIGEFLSDVKRVWKKDLVWDGNLIKRNFRYID